MTEGRDISDRIGAEERAQTAPECKQHTLKCRHPHSTLRGRPLGRGWRVSDEEATSAEGFPKGKV